MESIDGEDIKSNVNLYNDALGINPKFSGSTISNLNATFAANKNKPTKYFVNNYDDFTLNGPIFSIKRVERKTSINKGSSILNRKRTKQSEDVLTKSKELNQADDETRQKKAFKITKSSDKKENISNKETPEYFTDFEKPLKDSKSKLSNDTIPSPNGALTNNSCAPALKVAPRKKEDRKAFVYTKRSQKIKFSTALEPVKKISEDDFADFLFRDARKKTREPKKVSRSILEQPISHFNLNEDRVK